MFSKRLELINKKNKDDDYDIEEMVLSDSEIEEVFQINDKKNKNKRKTTKSLFNKKNPIIKETELIKERTPIKESQIYNRNNYESDEELNEILAKPTTKRKQSFENLLKDRPKSKNQINEKKNDDDEIICLSDGESNEIINCPNDDDDCIIDSFSKPITKPSRTRRRNLGYSNKSPTLISNLITNSTTIQPSNSSFDNIQLDPAVLASMKYVKQIRLKFKFKGSYKCVVFKSNEQFKDKLDEYNVS